MVTITGDPKEVRSADEKGTTRVYDKFSYAVEKTEPGDLTCPAKGITTIRQEVTINNQATTPDGRVCRDVFGKNTIWRVSGRCLQGVFYADPCGLTDRQGTIVTVKETKQ